MRFSRAPPARRKHRTMDNISRLLLLSLCGLCASSPLGRLLQRRRDAFEVYAREFARDYEPYMFAAIPLHAPVPVLRVLSRAPLQPPRARDAQPAPSARHSAYARPYEPAPVPAPAYYSHVPHYDVSAPQYLVPAGTTHYREPTRQYSESVGAAHYREPTRQYSEPAGVGAARYRESTRQYLKPPRQLAAAAEPEYEASSYDYSRDYARPLYYQKPRRQPAYEYAAEYDSYAPQPIRPSPLPQLTYAIAPTAYDSVAYSATQEAAPTVLYARPSPSGGFTYRRVPDAPAAPAAAATVTKKVPAPLKEKEKDPTFILKIHKYRIVKDDLI